MIRRLWLWLPFLFVTLALLALPGLALAQTAPPTGADPFPWQTAVATLINGAGVFSALWVFNRYIPIVREKIPALVPILAGGFGPAVGYVQNALTAWLGMAIVLDPLLTVFTSFTAVAGHQIYKNSVDDPKDVTIADLRAALARTSRR